MKCKLDRVPEPESLTAPNVPQASDIHQRTEFYRTLYKGIEPQDQPAPESLVFSEGVRRNPNDTVPREGSVVSLRMLMEIIHADIHQREMMIDYDLETLNNLLCLLAVGETISLMAHISPELNFNKAVTDTSQNLPRLIVEKLSPSHFLMKGVLCWGVRNNRSICSPANVGDLGMHSFGAAGGNTVNPSAIPRMS